MAKAVAADEALTEQTIKNKRRFTRKKPRNILMSHHAYLLFKAMADKKDIGIGDFFELLSQEAAEERLADPFPSVLRGNQIALTRLWRKSRDFYRINLMWKNSFPLFILMLYLCSFA